MSASNATSRHTALRAAASLGISALLLAAAATTTAQAADPVTFKDKTLTMIIGYAAGGGVDAAGRLAAVYFTKYLPGNPTIVARNMPGADGTVALNHFVRQVKPDGLTFTAGSGAQLEPSSYRSPNSQHDPATFEFIGGLSRGGIFLLMSKEAEKKLLGKGEPAAMGAMDGSRAGEQMVFWGKEFLDWNAKWVVGYRGTADTANALEKGEVDMASTANTFLIKQLLETGKFTLVAQTGVLVDGKIVPRASFRDVPLFPDLMAGKISDPAAKQAFDFWVATSSQDPWFGLPPQTPVDIVAVYRDAFRKVVQDPEFLEKGRRISDEIGAQTHEDMQLMVKKATELTDAGEAYLRTTQQKQGLRAGR
jgi:hypothetical protein